MKALKQVMKEDNITFTAKYNVNNHLTHFFIITPFGIKLFKKNCDVFILDSTYKTNQFGMPLLQVVGCTSMNTTFQVCLCFIRKEKEGDYQWAMEQLCIAMDKKVCLT